MATKKGARAVPAAADRHDVIRVIGARVNNLQDINVDIP
ncbi:MAG: hypothetical protein JWO77_743, partial [Ilumatobacteraceae bacterium]|nr:hypothetical protein [Ilumatobacteraceae bacterium]